MNCEFSIRIIVNNELDMCKTAPEYAERESNVELLI